MTRHSPYNYAFNNPIRFIDPDGRAPNFTFNIKTGQVKQVGETNDKPDRILKTNKAGEVVYNKKGEAKVEVDNIAKGILKDGQNFKKSDNIIGIGEVNQPTMEQTEDFLIKISNYVGVEFSGAYLSQDKSQDAKVNSIYIDEYDGNTNSSSSTTINRNDLSRRGLYTNIHFHTHPTNGYNRKDSLSSSRADRDFRDSWKEFYNKFIILSGLEIEKIDFTND